MDIELTNKNYIPIDRPIQQASFTFLFDEKPVRAYRLNLSPAVPASLAARKADILIILLTDSATAFVNKKGFYKKGDYLYVSSGTSITFNNAGSGSAEFAFFELK
jgi:hypothetical protein